MISNIFIKPSNTVTVLQRGTDVLAVVDVSDISKVTANEISSEAASQPNVPHYQADGAGVTLIFHTENETYVLGGIRNNPALEKELTKDNKPFPQQINSTIGGYLENPEISLKDAIIKSVKNKMFLQTELTKENPGFEAQQIIQQLHQAIEKDDGWEEKICVHTDKWTNKDSTIGIMCYLTAIKHIKCAYSELLEISKALETIMTIKKNESVNLKALSSFKFVPLQPIIENSLSSYFKNELTKATEAYEKFGDSVSVTFNDLAIATLAKNGAFKSTQFTQLTLSSNASRKNEEIESIENELKTFGK